MAADIEEESAAAAARLRRGRKRKRGNDRRKLLKDDKVEVRSIEEGFLGSWHSGTVIVCKDHVRQIQYNYLLSDDGFQNLVDHVQVSPAIDGVGPTKGTPPNNHRNFIRPPPPPHEFGKWSVHYGQCVDVLYEDAWWEGVIFDHENGSEERAVFFPDMGDELKARMDSLRITQDWDEVTGEWNPRGDWLFLELIEEIERECPVVISLKQIWYEVRVKKGFENLKDWTSSGRDAWKELIFAVVFDYFKVTALEFARNVNSSWDVSSLELAGLNLDDFLKSKSHFDYPLEVVPFEAINPVEEETNRGDDLDGRSDVNISTVSIAPEHEEVVKSPALSIVPSNPDELSRISSHNNREVSSSTSPKMPKPRHLWRLAGPDIVPEAEYCPDAIKEYIQTRPGYRCSNTLVLKTRKHISYLGWKIQYSKDDGKPGRVRYISPDNNKCYHSLRLVCQHLSQPDSQISSLVIEQPGHCQVAPREPSADNHVVIESEYCPQALVDYILFWKSEASNLKRDDRFQELKLRAMKHLCAVGWSFFYDLTWSPKEMQYRSPSDKICKNLLKACKKCKRDEGGKSRRQKINVDEDPTAENQPTVLVELGEVKVQGIRKRRRRRRKDHSFSKAEGTAALVKVTDDPNGTGSTRLLRSSKRARQAVVPSPSNNTPRTVLCWLIEKNVVLPRAKVYYQGQRDGRIFGEGRVTRDGIKCNCCQKIFSFRDFESHVGSTCKRPMGNLFLEDGKSLLECQLQLKKEICLRSLKVKSREGKCSRNQKNDHICSVCHYGGELVLCDQCPSSFHTSCLGLKEVPEGDWFCPSCCCRICGERGFNKDTERFTDNSTLNCNQCENQYHVGCLRRKGQFNLDCYPNENWFCNRRCEQIFRGLCKLLRKPIPLGVDNLTWTLLKHEPSENYNPNGSNIEELMEGYIKLHVALDVMHECFEPVKEPRTKRDLVEDVIFGRRSELNRLNFQGFYTVLLERNDELITAATLRVYGEKVAEVPLVATRFQYRRLGMCRILMNELEKKLTELGVERLVLPAVPSVLHTWTTSFGFSQMTEYERLKFLDHTFLDFQGTFMCQKLLTKTPSTKSSVFRQNRRKLCEDINRNDMIDFDGNSVVSEVFQADRVEENGILDQRSVDITEVDGTNGSNDTTAPLVIAVDQPTNEECVVQCQSDITIECSVDGTTGRNYTAPLVIAMDRPTDQDHVQCQSEVTIECSVETAAAADLHKEGENNNNDGLFKCYKRRRVSACLA